VISNIYMLGYIIMNLILGQAYSTKAVTVDVSIFLINSEIIYQTSQPIPSFTALVRAINSASVVERATEG